MNEQNPVSAVAAKYRSSGYDVIISPKDKITDLIAKKDRELFFVQVVTPETADNPRFQGIPRGDFIQNAFSNGATPTHAKVVTTTTRDGKINTKITFEDINAGARRIVTNRGNQKEEPQSQLPKPKPQSNTPSNTPSKTPSRTQSTPELKSKQPKPETQTQTQTQSQPQKPQQMPKPKIMPKRDESVQNTESGPDVKTQPEPKPRAPRQPKQSAESIQPQSKRVKGASTGQK